MIITSRNREAAGIGTAIKLGKMRLEDAVALLFHKAALHYPTSTEELIADIAKSLGYFALTIKYAGAYVISVDRTLQEYL